LNLNILDVAINILNHAMQNVNDTFARATDRVNPACAGHGLKSLFVGNQCGSKHVAPGSKQ
jgi:hypothetical protein